MTPDGDFWYPSCVVNLRLRFDESFRVVDLPAPGPQDGDPASSQLAAQALVEATVNADLGITPGKKKVGAPNYMTGTRPLITQVGKDNLSFVQDRVPKSATVELPGYRTAGKFTLEFDWRELPIDPRLVRSCGVEIFFGAVSPTDFSTGMTEVGSDGRRRSIMRTTDQSGVTRDDLMALAGIVDNWSTTHNDQGGTVKIDGRDLRGIFLDSPVNPAVAAKIDLTKPVPDVIAAILTGHPAAAYLKIQFSPGDWPGGKPPAVLDKEGLTRVRRKADGEGAGASSGDDIKAWDLITKYCFLVGAVPYFRGRTLIVRPALSLFDQSKPKFGSQDKVFDPATRYDDDGSPFETRRMVLGRNIKELSFERKLSGTKVPVVEVVSMDTSSPERGLKKMLIEQWPPKDKETARLAGVSPSGEVSQEDKLVITKAGIRDRDKLIGIARSVWEEVGRGELGGNCKTTQLSSHKGSNADPDLLRLRPGDVIEFLTDTRQVSDRVPGASTAIESTRASFEQAVQEIRTTLASKGQVGDENLARVIVASSRSLVVDLLRSFRTANVVYTWAIQSGMTIAFDFQNYFVVRYGINDQLGRNVVPVVETVVNPTTARRPKQRFVPQPRMAPANVFRAAAGINDKSITLDPFKK